MKKIILCLILAGLVTSSYTQHRVTNPSNSRELANNEYDIGITYFDRQSNRMLNNRIHRFDDGTIGVVWIYGEEFPDFPDRGTGYNYFNGTNWGPIPVQRIETFRAGWPSYTALGPGGELIVSHDNATKELCFLKREIKGEGIWEESMYSYSNGPTTLNWPRVTTGGTDFNSIHLLAVTPDEYLGQTIALVYSRSQDGGLTWNIENALLEGMGSAYYTGITSDSYAWAEERNGTIAFLCAHYLRHDMFFMTSTDDGDSWEKTVVWQHPYPFYSTSTVTDTFFCVDGSASIALDNNGKAHVVFGISSIHKEEPGGFFYIDESTDGIGYWNEDMETFSNDIYALAPPALGFASSEMVTDYNYIGWMQDVNGNGSIELNTDILRYKNEYGASTMPAITINDMDEIFVIYSSTTETFEYGEYNYKRLWGRAYSGGAWHPIVPLTDDVSHLFDECIYPMFTLLSDDHVHYIYQIDDTPGLAQGMSSHAHNENRVVYASVEKSYFIPVGIGENEASLNKEIQLTICPNPCADFARLRYLIHDIEYLKADLYGISGNLIHELVSEETKPGEYEMELDVSELPAGVYFIRIQAGDKVGGGKIVKISDS